MSNGSKKDCFTIAYIFTFPLKPPLPKGAYKPQRTPNDPNASNDPNFLAP